MNFAKFPVATTYIFPQVNSVSGGQLLSEYNLRCRESVATDSSVNYIIGPSYTHSMRDFEIEIPTGSSTQLSISAGTALVNGHFIQAATPVVIDLDEVNSNLSDGDVRLQGALTVGLRAFYSTEPTMAGTILTEKDSLGNVSDYFEGIQIVILPTDQFKLPADCPDSQSDITAHLKLADFRYIDGTISHIVNNPKKIQVLGSDRIGEILQSLGGDYITKYGLINQNLYVMSGNGTWCVANDSLMKWDTNAMPVPVVDGLPIVSDEAEFRTSTSGVALVVPHKQIDGLEDDQNPPHRMVIPDKVLPLPVADYLTGTPGIVNASYTTYIKDAVNKLNDIHRSTNGKQVWYIDELNSTSDLPKIQDSWEVGDYVLVRVDNTVASTSEQSPSTMYIILPGFVTSVADASTSMPANGTEIYVINDTKVPPATGIEFAETINLSSWRGTSAVDYFTYNQLDESEENIVATRYYVVATTSAQTYSSPILITGTIPFATESLIGGFLNVNSDEVEDLGYVYRDEQGNLRLVDYALLRSGEVAYQIGEDFESPAGISTEEVQVNLDEYVNERIAFPNAAQIASGSEHPEVINVTITLPKSETATTINIHDIDNRFESSIYLHILGEADSNTTINITNCAKIRIDENIGGTPIINLDSCNLYYDSYILGYLNSISGLKLWYQRYSIIDTDLLVDNLTVSVNSISEANINGIDLSSNNNSTDTHIKYALRGITFNPYGDIVGMSMFFGTNISPQVIDASGDHIIYVGDFGFEDGFGFNFPQSKLKGKIKVTGLHTIAYVSGDYFMTVDTNFSIVYGNKNNDGEEVSVGGRIGLKIDASSIPTSTVLNGDAENPITADTVISCWQPDTCQVYEGYIYG